MITIDRAQITASGKMTLGDLIQQLPAMTGGNVNPQVNNGGGTGASTVNLRGLGSNRTLVLVNGRRLMSKDPNAIPAEAIDRIEVLPTGASATYGSDAIGGVVNFILRKEPRARSSAPASASPIAAMATRAATASPLARRRTRAASWPASTTASRTVSAPPSARSR
ncbi:TonB-dependent receptor plug domain-containing protein [Rhodanobacter lindaniclasticus]